MVPRVATGMSCTADECHRVGARGSMVLRDLLAESHRGRGIASRLPDEHLRVDEIRGWKDAYTKLCKLKIYILTPR